MGTDARLRTDTAFDEMEDGDHHCGPCPIKPFPVGCVSQFVCLSVVRRLLLYWKGPIGPLAVRLGSRIILIYHLSWFHFLYTSLKTLVENHVLFQRC